MFDLGLTQNTEAFIALGIVGIMFTLFMRETFPVEVIAVSGASLMLILGILPYDMGLRVMSNHAPWTIAALFIIVGALLRTGTLDWISQKAARNIKARPVTTLVLLTITVLTLSAFVNNTPIVVVMIPIFMGLAKQLSVTPSKLLIPLSYLAIFGGTITLVGTSTNLIVDGVAQNNGLAPFGIFEITAMGLVISLVGITYLALFSRKLLPDRHSMSDLLTDRSNMKFFTEVAIPEGSPLIGQNIEDVAIFKREGARVIDVLRGDASLRRDMGSVVLAEGDRVVLRTQMSEVLSLKQEKGLRQVDKLSSVATTTVEALITPECRLIGHSLGSLRLRRRYGVYPLAVHRRNQNTGGKLDDVVVRVGDTLLLEGAMEDIQRLSADMSMLNISEPSQRAYRRSHAPVVISVLAGIVLLSALNIAPILALAVIGVAVVLLTRAIDADEAFSFVDGRLMALIFGMLAVGAGLDNSGAVRLIVEAIAPYMAGLPPFVIILAIYTLTSILTEMVTNNAIAVVVTPIAIGLGVSLGFDPRPLVVAVMFAASASFATPIGYQTNTLVYGPGGYRFSDFMRIGIPLNIVMAIAASLVIPLIWPL